MEPKSQSGSLRAFDLLRMAASEYNNSEFKFYPNGFFRFKREGKATFLIEDIYIIPEFRGTAVAHMILSDFEDFMRYEGILMYYGHVMRGSTRCAKRISTFENWGMTPNEDNPHYVTVSKAVSYE